MNRYAAYKVRTSCSHCGNPLVLNGPLQKPECPSCLNTVSIDPETWSGLLDGILEDYGSMKDGQGSQSTIMTGGFTFKVEYYRASPTCAQCDEPLDADSIPDGADSILTCASCGETMDSFPAPGWLTEEMPEAVQIFGGERLRTDETESSLAGATEAARPVVLSCPECNGTLKITTESTRIVECSYCDVDVYMPDAIWMKLHPVKVMKYWYLRLGDS